MAFFGPSILIPCLVYILNQWDILDSSPQNQHQYDHPQPVEQRDQIDVADNHIIEYQKYLHYHDVGLEPIQVDVL